MRRNRFRPSLQQLEDRLAPTIAPTGLIATPAGTIGTYTDANGNDVAVIVRGSGGTALFSDSGGNVGVVDNHNIATIEVNGANKNGDFTITFRHTATAGNDTILLGEITVNQNRAIRGIYINRLSTSSFFSLESFIGNGLSAHGSLTVDEITGNGSNIGLDLRQHGAKRSMNIGNVLISVSNNISGSLAGSLNVGNDLGGILTIGGHVTARGRINVRGNIFVIDIGLNLAGTITSGSQVSALQVGGSITRSARLYAFSYWLGVTVTGNSPLANDGHFNGQISSQGGINMTISRDVQAQAKLRSGGLPDLALNGRSVLAGAVISAGGRLSVTLTGSFAGQAVVGSVNGTFASVAPTASLSFGGGRVETTGNFAGAIDADQLDLVVGGKVTASAVIQANTISDSQFDLDDDAFFVGGSFGGILNVLGDLASGSGAQETLIGGDVLSTAIFSVGGFSGPTEFLFAGRWQGVVVVNGDLDTDLEFGNHVSGINSEIIIAGQVLADILVDGSLSFLSSASGFEVTSTNSGFFVTADGSVTGTLTVNGKLGTVLPSV